MAMQANINCAIVSLIFILFDLGISLLGLGWHGEKFLPLANIRQQITTPYSFFRSTIDLFLLTLIRVGFISLGCAIIFFKRNANVLMSRLGHLSLSCCILFCSFSPTKLLALSEERLEPPQKPVIYIGDWIFFIHNFLFALWAHSIWNKFVGATKTPPSSYSQLINESLETTFTTTSSTAEANIDVKSTLEIIVGILEYCKNEWLWHLSGFTWLFIYSLTRIFVPYYTGQVIDSVVDSISTIGDKYALLIESIKLMLFISVVSAVAGGFRAGSFEYVYARINRAVRANLFSSLVRQEIAFFDSHKTGEITSRLTADTQTMSDTVALNMNIFLRNMVQLVGSMLFMMALSWKLSLVPFIVVPIILLASKIFGVYYDFLSEKTQETVAHANDVAEEVLSTMRTVRSFACEDEEAIRFYKKLTDTLNITKKKAFAYVGYLWISDMFQTVINVAVLWYGGHLVLSGQLKKDLLVSFLLYQMQLADNISQLGDVWTGLMQSVGASRKVFEYIDRVPQIDITSTFVPDKLHGKIEFQNVHFSYPTRPENPILRGLTFTVNPGEVIALVGPSGGGKSSCIALIEHFYRATSGKVLLDGIDIKDYDHSYIHNKIALVGQEPILFARSVAENIAYGVSDCTTIDDVIESAKMANAHNFIMNTSDQYETNVGEKGSQMSGGQKQRIAIARALIRKPVILLLDEATSALDTESEHLVQEAIYKNLCGKSVILIAHRLSTVEKADKIVLINKGLVEQIGTHEELLNQDGMYRSLVQRQMFGGGGGGGGIGAENLSNDDSPTILANLESSAALA